MAFVITGATGQLGRLVVQGLLDAGIAPAEVVATGRDAAKLHNLEEQGVGVRRVDLADVASLERAFGGHDRVLLISTTTPEERFANHRRAIDAAAAAGVELLVYTSTLNAGTAQMLLADEHRRTEEYLRESGVPFVILRNGWYLENYTDQLPTVRETGILLGAAGRGSVNAASRGDLATAAVVALTGGVPLGTVLELGGEGFTLEQLAKRISAALGRPVTYRDVEEHDYAAALVAAGVPDTVARYIADADSGLSRGELATASTQLHDLLGRPPIGLDEAITGAVNIAR